MVERLLRKLQGWCRKLQGKSEVFPVKTLYQALDTGGDLSFPVAIIRNSLVPPKVSLFSR